MSQTNSIGFQIKICGVRTIDHIGWVQDAAPTNRSVAVGLNFFPPSVRYLDPAKPLAREVSDAAAKAGLLRVGVFVNESANRILEICDSVGLDIIQLHGDEEIEFASELNSRLIDGESKSLIRAIKLPTTDLSVSIIQQQVAPWVSVGCDVLLDADAGANHGGSGKTLNWDIVGKWATKHPNVSWTLAGGLNPKNVADSIRKTAAKSVDTASGVEETRGTKSAGRIREFVHAAASAM